MTRGAGFGLASHPKLKQLYWLQQFRQAKAVTLKTEGRKRAKTNGSRFAKRRLKRKLLCIAAHSIAGHSHKQTAHGINCFPDEKVCCAAAENTLI
jgi:hypothetical protein